MSENIDQRIVDMRFNNRQFESGIKESLSSLDKLKNGLDLSKSTRGLNSLGDAARKFSIAGIADGVDAIASKFSALGVMGVTTLVNLTNSAVNMGKRFVSSLTIDPIKMGFEEYETKMNAIQTILTNTQSKGTTMDQVTDVLADLNTYADKTIYNFAEMTRNIGTFTAAGIGLKESATAIKGIANLAAGSGSNAQQASTAMYQLSQALAAGSVKLQDWNSVVNAGMGGELFQNALKNTAKQMGIFVDESVPFRLSLEQGWITSEVLTKTLAGFAEDEMLIKAATQVKTFTQLFDTMKESVQSGWAVSWENIIGDKEEAAATLTAINDEFGRIAGTSADARNAILSVWKANGGRDALIESFSNIYKAIGSIIKPVQEAFKEMFPPMTAEKLVALTEKFKNFTAKLKIGEKTAAEIKKIFKGLFAIVDIGRQGFSALGKGVKNFVNFLIPGAKGLLTFSGSIGDWLVNMDNAIKKNGTFTKALDKVQTKLSKVYDKVEIGFANFKKSFESFTGINLSGFDKFTESVKSKFEPLGKISDWVSTAFDKIGEVFKKITPVFSNVGKAIGSAFSGANLAGLTAIVSTGMFASIILTIKKLIDSFREISDGAGGFLKGITDILSGVKDSLKAYQTDIKAGTILKIAGAIAILAGSLFLMSTIDPSKLNGALTAITVLFTELFGSMAIFEKIVKGEGFRSMGKVTRAMLSLSVSLLILSAATSKLAGLDWDDLSKGLAGVTVLAGVLVGTSKLLASSSGQLIKGSFGMLIFATALRVLVTSVSALGNLDTSKMIQGILGLIAVMGMLALFMYSMNFSSMAVAQAAGLMMVAVAVRILASAVATISKLDTGGINTALTAIGILLAELAGFTRIVGNGKGLIATAAGMVLMGIAMNIFAKAVEKFGNMPILTMVNGLAGLTAALLAITFALRLMPPNMAGIGAGMLMVSVGVLLLAKAVEYLGSQPIEVIVNGLAAMAGVLTMVVVATNAMTGAMAGAGAILIVSAALIGLSFAMKLLGSMSLEQVAVALIAIAGALTIFGVAALVLTPIMGSLYLLGGAMVVLGLGLAAVGAASLVLAMGLGALSVAGFVGVGVLLALTAAMIPLAALSPVILVAGAALLVLSVGVFAIAGGLALLTGGLGLLVALGPAGLQTLTKLTMMAAMVSEFAIELLAAGTGMLLFGAGALVAGAGALVAGIGLIALAFGLKMLSKVDITNMTGFSALAADILIAAGALLLASPGLLVGGAALLTFGAGAKAAGDGLSLIDVSIQGIVKSAKQVPKDIEDACDAIVAAINAVVDEVITSLEKKKPDILVKIGEMTDASAEAIKEKRYLFTQSGTNVADGFIYGIKSKIREAANAAAHMASSALASANAVLDINSPSGAFIDVAKYSILGLVKGFKRYTLLAENAATNLGQATLTPVVEMSKKAFTDTNILQKGFDEVSKKSAELAPTIKTETTQTVKHEFGVLRVEGVNDEGELVAVADYSMEEMLTSLMRRQSRT